MQFRTADLIGGDVWRLSGLLRGQQGTEAQTRVGAGVGAEVVMLDDALVRLDMRAGERGLPMVWRAGPAGAPPGGDGFVEAAFAWRGVHDRPWAPAHLTVEQDGEGRRIRWIARARLDGDRWDGETAGSDPMRFRVRMMDGEAVVRVFEVEACEAAYDGADLATDFPDGPGEAVCVAVSQWSPTFGWGVEAAAGL